MVKVLPEPVTPRSVWRSTPFSRLEVILEMASGWSPEGTMSVIRSKDILDFSKLFGFVSGSILSAMM